MQRSLGNGRSESGSALSLLAMLSLLALANGEVISGELNTMESWKFVGRFCFLDGGESQIEYSLSLPSHSSAEILVYTDGYEKFAEVQSSQMTCIERGNRAAYRRSIGGHVARKTDVNDTSTATYEWREGTGRIRVQALLKPRWFFVVMANCNEDPRSPYEVQDSMRLTYEFKMTNAMEESDRYHYHFSADEQGILQQELVFFVLQCLLVICCYFECQELMRRRMFHYTVQLLAWSVFLHFVGIMVSSCACSLEFIVLF
jgi:hypothetical protein